MPTLKKRYLWRAAFPRAPHCCPVKWRRSRRIFIDVLTAERLIEKLQSFDEISLFVFFKIPNAISMDTIEMHPYRCSASYSQRQEV